MGTRYVSAIGQRPIGSCKSGDAMANFYFSEFRQVMFGVVERLLGEVGKDRSRLLPTMSSRRPYSRYTPSTRFHRISKIRSSFNRLSSDSIDRPTPYISL